MDGGGGAWAEGAALVAIACVGDGQALSKAEWAHLRAAVPETARLLADAGRVALCRGAVCRAEFLARPEAYRLERALWAVDSIVDARESDGDGAAEARCALELEPLVPRAAWGCVGQSLREYMYNVGHTLSR